MADSDNSMGHLEEESMLIDHSPAIHCDLEESNEVFNEEEEMLVAKMFKLVGERFVHTLYCFFTSIICNSRENICHLITYIGGR